MNKAEALIEMNKKQQEGFLVHPMILEIYEDDEILPEGIEILLWRKVEPQNITIYTGKEGFKMKEDLWEELKKSMNI